MRMWWSRAGEAGQSSTRPETPLSRRRLFVRTLACITALVLADTLAVRAAGPEPRIDSEWRAPAKLPSATLPAALRALDRSTAANEPLVAFTGASPTWGDGLADGSQTLPAEWARLSRDSVARGGAGPAGPADTPRVVNLAFNGQLMADTGTIARAASRRADVIFVQVTYRTFSPDSHGEVTRRFPELPRLLAEPVGRSEAAATRTRRTPTPDVTGAVERGLRRVWRLYDLRDTLAARWLGASPDEHLHRAWEDLTLPPLEDDDARPPDATFDDLPPDEQTALAEEWAADAQVALEADDPELAALDVLAADLASDEATVVVYLAPVNTAALESFGYLDRTGYDRNVSVIRRAVEQHGIRFIDLNRTRTWRGSDFIDISHTTAAGTAIAARALWNETSSTVGGAR